MFSFPYMMFFLISLRRRLCQKESEKVTKILGTFRPCMKCKTDNAAAVLSSLLLLIIMLIRLCVSQLNWV